MKKLLGLFMLLVVVIGCGATQPLTREEMFPAFNNDPTKGIIVLEGAPAADLFFYDQAGKLVESWAYKGSDPAWRYNGLTQVGVYVYNLPKGYYKVEVRPFYYHWQFFPPERYRIELPYQYLGVYVGDNPSPCYDSLYTRRSWGWCLYVSTGDIPQYDYQTPSINIQGTGLMNNLIEGLRRR